MFTTTFVLFPRSGLRYGKYKDKAELRTYYLYINYFDSTNGNEICYNISSHGKDSFPVVHRK